MSFNTRLREARKKSGMTQAQLSDALGIAKSTLSGYENGSSEPSVAMTMKIMGVLEIDANYLYQDCREADMRLSVLESGIIDMYRKLDEHGQRIVDAVLREEYSRIVEMYNES